MQEDKKMQKNIQCVSKVQVAHSCDFSSLEVEENGQKFEASLGYTMTSSPAEDNLARPLVSKPRDLDMESSRVPKCRHRVATWIASVRLRANPAQLSVFKAVTTLTLI